MYCNNCGKKLPDTAKFCTHCGQKVKPLVNSNVCSQCGTVNKEGINFCIKCGQKLNSNNISNRVMDFKPVFELPNDLYNMEASLILNSGVILVDGNQVEAILTFTNLSDKAINAMKVKINQLDPFNQELGSVEYDYLDLRNQSFGNNKPIEMKLNTRSMSIEILQIVYTDLTMVEFNTTEWKKLPTKLMLTELISEHALEQYNKEFVNKAKYKPLAYLNLKQCTCGTVYLDNLESCPQCGINFNRLVERLDEEQLEKDYEADLLEKAYQQACNQLSNASIISQYEQCISLFEQLSDYKDSLEQIEYCKNQINEQKEKIKEQKKAKKIKLVIVTLVAVVMILAGFGFMQYKKHLNKMGSQMYVGTWKSEDQMYVYVLNDDFTGTYTHNKSLNIMWEYKNGNILIKNEEGTIVLRVLKIIDDNTAETTNNTWYKVDQEENV